MVGDVTGLAGRGFEVACLFIEAATAAGLDLSVSCVAGPTVDLAQVEAFVKLELGVTSFKIRSWIPLPG